ncbi:MAG: xanthine dehydrogenase accessory protein XdhC [Pseudomonadota bacterium]
MTAIRVTVVKTAGSVPREAGTQMLVFADRIEGTIGGGALEWEAMRRARTMLAEGVVSFEEAVPLGPSRGQCCGGSVTLHYEVGKSLFENDKVPLWIYGAGHVGRALVAVMGPLPDVAITWIDTTRDRFPEQIPDGVTLLVAADPARVVAHAPKDADHLILTYSHDLDLAICHAILSRPFGSAGLIGSATKWARFRRRLQALGHDTAQIARIACPIGDPTLGKHPQAIALGVATAMMARGHGAQRNRAG